LIKSGSAPSPLKPVVRLIVGICETHDFEFHFDQRV
jgi:hypothetical protein